jgi:hypothetical protein
MKKMSKILTDNPSFMVLIRLLWSFVCPIVGLRLGERLGCATLGGVSPRLIRSWVPFQRVGCRRRQLVNQGPAVLAQGGTSTVVESAIEIAQRLYRVHTPHSRGLALEPVLGSSGGFLRRNLTL